MKKFSLLGAAATVAAVGFIGCKSTPSSPKPQFSDYQAGHPGKSHGKVAPEMTTVTNEIDPSWTQRPTNLFTLGPGDRLEIELLGDPGSRMSTVVGPDGKIYFNLLPGVDVWGLTLGQTRQVLENELGKYIRNAPQVTVTLREVESKRVWLLGRFQAPGVYTLSSPMTLLEGISMAGGSSTFTGTKEVSSGPLGEDLADLKHSFIIRGGRLLPVDFDRLVNHGDLSQNIYLEPDDFVYFTPAFTREVYVLGAVVQPKPVPYNEGMTVAEAIAGAYGTVRDAYLYHVVVVRGSVSQPEIAVVNYKDIVFGKAPDITLEPHDIVYVPWAPYRYLRKYADIALNTFVSSIAINAGIRALSPPNAVPAGIFIPVGSGIQVIPPTPPPIH